MKKKEVRGWILLFHYSKCQRKIKFRVREKEDEGEKQWEKSRIVGKENDLQNPHWTSRLLVGWTVRRQVWGGHVCLNSWPKLLLFQSSLILHHRNKANNNHRPLHNVLYLSIRVHFVSPKHISSLHRRWRPHQALTLVKGSQPTQNSSALFEPFLTPEQGKAGDLQHFIMTDIMNVRQSGSVVDIKQTHKDTRSAGDF